MNESLHIGNSESLLEACLHRADAIKQSCADKVLLTTRQIRKLEKKTKENLHANILKILAGATEELIIRHSKMNQVIMESVWRRSCVKFRKDIQYLSIYLSVEAKVPISLKYFGSETQQARRFQDVVLNSIDKRLLASGLIRGAEAVEVSSIFKVDNQFLFESFQARHDILLSSQSDVKIKGLFCVVSKASASSISCYGLLGHSNIRAATNSISTVIRDLDEKLFCTPWYLRPTPSAVGSTNMTSGSGNQQMRKSAKLLAGQHPVISANVRFSKHSVNASLLRSHLVEEMSRSGSGVCLVLCRVLLHRVCTVPGSVFPEDVDIACERGYDSIYSQANDEYVILRGEHVQPEFIMHISADTTHSLIETASEIKAEATAHAQAVMESMITPGLNSFMESLISPPSMSEQVAFKSSSSTVTAAAATTSTASDSTAGHSFLASERDVDAALSVLALQRQVALAQIDAASDRFSRAREEVTRDMFTTTTTTTTR